MHAAGRHRRCARSATLDGLQARTLDSTTCGSRGYGASGGMPSLLLVGIDRPPDARPAVTTGAALQGVIVASDASPLAAPDTATNTDAPGSIGRRRHAFGTQ